MKTSLCCATIVASFVLAALAANPAAAQATRDAAPDSGIRVIDVKKIFEGYTLFKRQKEDLIASAKAYEEGQLQELKDIQALKREAATLKSSDPQRKQMEEDAFTRETALRAKAASKKKEYVEKEAKIHCYTYKAIQEEVAEYCRVTGVNIVLSYNSEKIDPENNVSIMRGLNNTVIAIRRPELDITPLVLEELNRRAARLTGRTGPAGDIPRNN